MICECLCLHCQLRCERRDHSNYVFIAKEERWVELKWPQNLLLRARKQKVGMENCWKGEKMRNFCVKL